MSEMPTSTENDSTEKDKLISAGTPSDSASIQFLETLSVAGLAGIVGGAWLFSWPIAMLALSLASGATAGVLHARTKRIRENEIEARYARYQFFKDREQTVDLLPAPDDVKKAIKEMVTEKSLTRFEVATKLKIRIGEARANQFLPVVLQQADRTLETPKSDTAH